MSNKKCTKCVTINSENVSEIDDLLNELNELIIEKNFKTLNINTNEEKNEINEEIKAIKRKTSQRSNVVDSNENSEKEFKFEEVFKGLIKTKTEFKEKEYSLRNEEINEVKVENRELESKVTENTENSTEDLENWFNTLDEKHFGGELAKNKVQVKWSNRLSKTLSQTIAAKDQKALEIQLSRKLLESRPKRQLIEALYLQMERIYKLMKDNKLEIIENKRKTKLNDNKNEINNRFNTIESVGRHLTNNINKKDSKSIELEEKIQEIESKSLIDDRLEELDPKPNLQNMFKRYDKQYFDGILTDNNVEINWSTRLSTSLGITYEAQDWRPIQIRISTKLSKSRRDIVETLLHEMIHAFHYILDIEPHREHGPEFIKMAKELYAITGANPHEDTCL